MSGDRKHTYYFFWPYTTDVVLFQKNLQPKIIILIEYAIFFSLKWNLMKKIKYQNRIPEPGTTISGFVDNKTKKNKKLIPTDRP
jgi:hypothetical protein